MILHYERKMHFEDEKVLTMINLTGLSEADHVQRACPSIQIIEWLRQGEEVRFNKKINKENYSKDRQQIAFFPS